MGDLHRDNLCHLCLGASPVFSGAEQLRAHLVSSHSLDLNGEDRRWYSCPDCHVDDESSASSLRTLPEYQSHLLEAHLTRGDVLKPMRKRRTPKEVLAEKEAAAALSHISAEESAEDAESPPKRARPGGGGAPFELRSEVRPLFNAGGQDCFALASLHLLAQTDLASLLEKRGKSQAQRVLSHNLSEVSHFVVPRGI